MGFSVPRAQLLRLVADAMEVPESRRSALLGRFQHLQRLSLVEGINPGRGTAAEYQAHHVLVVLISFQMLQLGLTPERAVSIIKQNQDRVRLAISLAVCDRDPISPSVLWFDPAILTQSQGKISDLAEATFNYGGQGTGTEMFEHFFVKGSAQRMAFISVSGTLWHLVAALEGEAVEFTGMKPVITERSETFLNGLRDWFAHSTPDSLA